MKSTRDVYVYIDCDLLMRPHHLRISLSALAARPGASSVEDRSPGVQSLTRTCAAILRAT